MKNTKFILLCLAVVLSAASVYANGYIWWEAEDLGGGWKWLDWFGYFNDNYHPWVKHMEHDWWYCSGKQTSNLYFYDRQMGWLWTRDTLYPWLYKFNEDSWMFYQKGSSPRYFYNGRTGLWYCPTATRDNTGYTVLFSENFNTFPGSKWTYAGSPRLDRGLGYPSSPAICLDASDSIIAFASGWTAAGGLEICVRVRDAASCAHEIKVYSDAGEYPYASVAIAYDGRHTFDYNVWLAGEGGSHYASDEALNADYARKRWFDLCFTINPDGTSAWSRDGVRMLHVTTSFPPSNLKLQIRAVRDCAGPVYFDDVIVRRRN